MKILPPQSHTSIDGNSSPQKSTFNVRKISNVPKSILRSIAVFFGLCSNKKRPNVPKSHTSNIKVAAQQASGNNLSTTSPSVKADAPKDKTDLQPTSGDNLSTTSPSEKADVPKDKTDLQPTSGNNLSTTSPSEKADAPKDKTDLQPTSGDSLSTTSPSEKADVPKDKTDLQPTSGNNLSTTSPSVKADAPKDKTDLQPTSGDNLSTTSPSEKADVPKDKTDLQPTSGDSLSNRSSAQRRLEKNPRFKALQEKVSSEITSKNSLLNPEQKKALDVKNRDEQTEKRLQKLKNEDGNIALTSNYEPIPNPNPNFKPGHIPPPPPLPSKKTRPDEKKVWETVQVDDSFSKNNNKTKAILTPKDKTRHAMILSLNEAMTNSSLFKAQKEDNNQED